MELILELILTFILAPIWEAIVVVFRFAFWMICGAIWQVFRGVCWLICTNQPTD